MVINRLLLAGAGIAGIGGLVWWLLFSLSSPDISAREFAVARLTNQATLIKVATGDRDSVVRKVAVAKLTDQPTLGGIATEDPDSSVRMEAVAKLSEQATLVKIATSDDVVVVVAGRAAGKLTVEFNLIVRWLPCTPVNVRSSGTVPQLIAPSPPSARYIDPDVWLNLSWSDRGSQLRIERHSR